MYRLNEDKTKLICWKKVPRFATRTMPSQTNTTEKLIYFVCFQLFHVQRVRKLHKTVFIARTFISCIDHSRTLSITKLFLAAITRVSFLNLYETKTSCKLNWKIFLCFVYKTNMFTIPKHDDVPLVPISAIKTRCSPNTLQLCNRVLLQQSALTDRKIF